MPRRCLLVGLAHAEDGRLVEGLADELQAYWQAIREAARHGERRQAGQVPGLRVAPAGMEDMLGLAGDLDVALGDLPPAERQGRRREHVHAGEGAVIILRFRTITI